MAEAVKEESRLEKLMNWADKIAGLAQIPVIQAIQSGLVATTAPTLIGSIFLILSLCGTPGSFGSEDSAALIPFLEPYAEALGYVNSMTLGFIGFYAAYSIAKCYAEILGVDSTQGGLLGIISFFFISFAGTTDSTISTEYFGSDGLIVAMITSLISVKIYSLFIKHNFTIRLPDSVPSNVGESFAMLVPMAVIITICWFVRSILNFNLPAFLSDTLAPLLSGGDTLPSYIFFVFLDVGLWAFGLNGPGITGAATTPINTKVLEANTAAALAGETITGIWTNSFLFSFIWVGSVWPIVIWFIISKNPGKRALGIAAAPALVFNIIEPTMFGTPVCMNPRYMIPFVINGVLGPVIGYVACMIGFIAHPYCEVPWATPPFISGVIITGDWKILIVQAIVLVVGMIIYYPFIANDLKAPEETKEVVEA